MCCEYGSWCFNKSHKKQRPSYQIEIAASTCGAIVVGLLVVPVGDALESIHWYLFLRRSRSEQIRLLCWSQLSLFSLVQYLRGLANNGPGRKGSPGKERYWLWPFWKERQWQSKNRFNKIGTSSEEMSPNFCAASAAVVMFAFSWRNLKIRDSVVSTINVLPGNTNWRGRHSTVDLLIRVACFVKK